MVNFCQFCCPVLIILAISSHPTSPYVILKWQWDDEDSSSGEDGQAVENEQHKVTLRESDSELHFGDLRSEEEQRVLPITERTSCSHDTDCGYGRFCHRYYRYCQRHRYIGELCRRNENCYTGLICMWGRCMKAKMPGTEFSRCSQDLDCKPGMCCGREHGETVCKKYLQKNDDCSVPDGGIQFSIHGKCPCAPGLTCRKTSSITRDWRQVTTMKCRSD